MSVILVLSLFVPCSYGGVIINRTGLHRATPVTGPHRAGNDRLFHFDDELKGVRQANYPQLTKEMNPSRHS